MARLARDAEFDGLRIHSLRKKRLAPIWRVECRPSVGGVALNADAVPTAALGKFRKIWRVHGGRPPRNPPRSRGPGSCCSGKRGQTPFFVGFGSVGRKKGSDPFFRPDPCFEQLDRRELAQHTVVAGRVPENLLLVRAGRHHDAAAGARRRIAFSVPIRLIELRPQFATAPFEKHRTAIGRVYAYAIEIGRDGVGRRDLRHGPVIGSVPACVLTGMAGPAGLRGCVAVFGELNGSIGNRALGRARRRFM